MGKFSDVDAIVIGSGAGGLTAAVALAKAGQSVLVLEQHDVPGGWCHSFTLEGHRFSPGVHYIGQLGPGGGMRRIYEGLGVANDLTFFELNPNGFDHVHVAGHRFDIPKGQANFRRRMIEHFPHEAAGIDRYFDIVAAVAKQVDELPRLRPSDFPSAAWRLRTLARFGLRSLDSVTRSLIKDPVARGVLSIQAGDYGLAPQDTPLAMHAAVQAHYFDGAFYPRGGGFTIPRAFVRALKRHGGKIALKARVKGLLLDRSQRRAKVIGVRLADGTEIRAKHVISNADPHVTYGKLMPADALPLRLRLKLRRTRYSIGCLSLFMTGDFDADALGLDSGNYWWSHSADVGKAYRMARDPRPRALLQGIPGGFLTVTSLKDRTKFKGQHTMESFAFVGYDAFKRWAHTEYGQRPDDYEALKADLSAAMIAQLDTVAPGLSKSVTWSALGTPLTNEYYCMSTRGNLYGTEKSLFQVGPFGYGVKTPFDGLTLCGASTLAHGVMGATITGLAAAQTVLKARLSELMHSSGQSVTILPADDVSSWPAQWQRRAG